VQRLHRGIQEFPGARLTSLSGEGISEHFLGRTPFSFENLSYFEDSSKIIFHLCLFKSFFIDGMTKWCY
jgi:hypothetical protein